MARSLRGKQTKGRQEKAPIQYPDIVSPEHYIYNVISTFPIYSSSFLKIQTKKGTLVNLSLNSIQRLLEEICVDITSKGRLIRLLVLKARREGVSTWVSGKFFWRTSTFANRYAMIVTHEPEATDFIFNMHKRFLKHLPSELRPEELYNNKKVLEFNNDAGTGLDSAIRVGTAGKEDFGSAQLIHYLHLSELAKYQRHICTNLLLSLLQTVPNIIDSSVIMESTAKGVGGEFYDRYWDSRYKYIFYLEDGIPKWREEINEKANPDNVYSSIFIPWFVFDEYQMEVPEGFKQTPEEEELIKLYNLTNERLQWRRWYIENQCSGKVDLFNQEYPATDIDAFISQSDNVFDLRQLMQLVKITIPPKVRYELQLPMGNWIVSSEGRLKVWEEPRGGSRYAIGGDVSDGLHRGDFSSLDVVECASGKQVAHWHGKVPPEQLGYIAYALGSRYNGAVIAIERNDPGRLTIDRLTALNYRNIYVERIIDPPNKPRKRYGWLTTNKSKPLVIFHLAAEMRETGIMPEPGDKAFSIPTILPPFPGGVYCKETLEEMMFFKQNEDGGMEAEAKHNDDRVMSIAIAKYVASKYRRSRFAPGGQMGYNINRGTGTPVSPKGWT